MSTSPPVFISYRRATSADVAKLIHDGLEARGISAYRDLEDLEAGAWSPQLSRALLNAQYLVVVLAPDTLVNSPNVSQEIDVALKAALTIIPVLINGYTPAQLSSDMPSLARFNAVFWDSSQPQRGLDKIAAWIQPSPTVTTKPSTPPAKPPMRVEVLVALIGLFSALLVAIVGIVPNLLQTAQAQAFVDQTATAVQATNSAVYTLNTQSGITATANVSLNSSTIQVPNPTQFFETVTPIASQVSNVPSVSQDIVLFVSPMSLDILVNDTKGLNLTSLVFEVVSGGNSIVQRMDGYEVFIAPLRLLEPPYCLRVINYSQEVPLPQECPVRQTVVQELQTGNLFWYDSVSTQVQSVIVQIGGNVIGICSAGQTKCEFSL